MGAYCVCKSAVDMYSDVLHVEMKKWGVIVSVIHHSAFQRGKYLVFKKKTNHPTLHP